MSTGWPRPHEQRALLRRTRWRVAVRGALLVTGVLALLAGAAYAVARQVVVVELRETLERVSAQPGTPDADQDDAFATLVARAPAPPGVAQDPDAFFIARGPGGTPTAYLRRRAHDGAERWLTMPVGRDLRTLRAFLAILAALALTGGIVAMPLGYLLAGEALRPLDEAVRTRSEFVALASHRLRTPLSVIRTSADLALEGVGLPPTEALEVIQGQTTQMEALAGRLSALARVEALPVPRGEETDLVAAVAAAAGSLAPAAQGAGIELRVHGAGPIAVAATPHQVADILASILENAVAFTPRAGTVDVRVRRAGRFGLVEVADTGPGIDPSDVALIARPFFQGRRVRGGLGLGLAIARAAVAAARGRLEFGPGEGGRGTTVRVLLPLCPRGPRRGGPDRA